MGEGDLVDALSGLQRANQWSDAEMARQLGVSQSYWTMVRRRARRPGGKLLAGVEATFPTLRPAVSLFLRRRFTKKLKNAPQKKPERGGDAG